MHAPIAMPAKQVEANAAVHAPIAAPAKHVEAKTATHTSVAVPEKHAEAKVAALAPKAVPAKPVDAKAAVQAPKAAPAKQVADVKKDAETTGAAMPRKALPQAASTNTSPFGSVEDQFRTAFAAVKVC